MSSLKQSIRDHDTSLQNKSIIYIISKYCKSVYHAYQTQDILFFRKLMLQVDTRRILKILGLCPVCINPKCLDELLRLSLFSHYLIEELYSVWRIITTYIQQRQSHWHYVAYSGLNMLNILSEYQLRLHLAWL